MTTRITAPGAGAVLDRRFTWSGVDPDANLDHLLRFAYRELVVALGRCSREPAGPPAFHLHQGRLDVVIATRPARQRRSTSVNVRHRPPARVA